MTMGEPNLRTQLNALTNRCDALEAEIDRIKAAAEPFAEVADAWPQLSGEEPITSGFRLATYRRLRDAIRGKDAIPAGKPAEPEITVKEVLGWLSSQPGASWKATITDVHTAVVMIRDARNLRAALAERASASRGK